MKEAAGEANMTIVTIVLIGIVLAAGTLIVTNIVGKMDKNTGKCNNNTQIWDGEKCVNRPA